MLVREIMTKDVVTLNAYTSLREASEVLAQRLDRMNKALGVRVVRPEEELLVTGELHDQREHLFLGISADPDVFREVLPRGALHLRGVFHVPEAVAQSFQPLAHPTGHRLDRCRGRGHSSARRFGDRNPRCRDQNRRVGNRLRHLVQLQVSQRGAGVPGLSLSESSPLR